MQWQFWAYFVTIRQQWIDFDLYYLSENTSCIAHDNNIFVGCFFVIAAISKDPGGTLII